MHDTEVGGSEWPFETDLDVPDYLGCPFFGDPGPFLKFVSFRVAKKWRPCCPPLPVALLQLLLMLLLLFVLLPLPLLQVLMLTDTDRHR